MYFITYKYFAERQGYEPTLQYPWNSISYQYVNALGGTT